MSYTIFYRSMFVKLSNGKYIPMMEMGDNNVYEANYGRGKAKRVRDWSNMCLNNGQKFFDKEEIRNHLAEWNDGVDKKRNNDLLNGDDWQKDAAKNATFGYYEGIAVYGKGGTSGTTFNDVKNIVMGGVKNSISLEDAIKHCGLHICYWEKDNAEDYFACKRTLNFSDEEEMFTLINENFGDDNKNWYFVFSDCRANIFYNFRKAISGFMKKGNKNEFVLKVRVINDEETTDKYVSVDGYSFVLVDDLNNAMWFSKYSSNGMDINDFIYRYFPKVKATHFIYKKD